MVSALDSVWMYITFSANVYLKWGSVLKRKEVAHVDIFYFDTRDMLQHETGSFTFTIPQRGLDLARLTKNLDIA